MIDIINKYDNTDKYDYNIDVKLLKKIKPELISLDKMIGIQKLKQNVLDQLLYFIQNLHVSEDGSDYKHTVIYGPPGTGKTEVAKIMGRIFSNLGILKNNVFKKVTRDDLVAGYLGQTAIKTKDVIKELKSKFPMIEGPKADDICYATQNRQDAIKQILPQADILFVVGSKNSSNSNRLKELGEKKGIPSILIDDMSDFNPAWLDNKKNIAQISELHSQLNDSQESLQNYVFQKSMQQLEDLSLIKKTRKNIARIKTLLTEVQASEKF